MEAFERDYGTKSLLKFSFLVFKKLKTLWIIRHHYHLPYDGNWTLGKKPVVCSVKEIASYKMLNLIFLIFLGSSRILGAELDI